MVKKNILVLILISLSLTSCFIVYRNYYRNPEGGTRPKHSKFELSKNPYQLKQEDLIDTNSVYIQEIEYLYRDEETSGKSFLRFFENGRYYLDSDLYKDNTVDLDIFNDVKATSDIGYYKITNHNEIELEYFDINHSEGKGFYRKSKGYIRNDSIILYVKAFYKDNNYPPTLDVNCNEKCGIYVRKPIEGLTGKPDW
jgi:hypothetical protein